MEISAYYSKSKSIFGLSLQLAKANFKLKNEGSYLGILWYLLNPILTFALTYSIFFDRLGRGIEKYPLYLLLGIIMFNVFQSSAGRSMGLISGEYSGLIKSVNFDRTAIVISAVLENFFSHFFELTLFLIIFIALGGEFLVFFCYIPVLILFAFFITGFCFLSSALAVYFVDLGKAWGFISRLIWLATPIFYQIGGQTKLFYLNLLNPMYYFITFARETVLYGRIPPAWIILGSIAWSIGFFALGLLIFNKLKKGFAELV